MSKEKNLKPSKELPLGFVDRQEQELLIRDFVISNIKEVMIKYGFQYLETPSFEYTAVSYTHLTLPTIYSV